MRRYLDVPFADKDEAKARGARWDPSARRWFVADGIDETSFRRWWPLERKMQGPTVAVRLVMLPDSCYRCGGRVWAIVGVLLPFGTELGENVAEITDTGLFLQFDGCCEVLARALDEEWLRAHGIGSLRERWSRTAGGKYVSNGCVHCDALLGDHPLWEDLVEYLAEGGTHEALASVIPETVALPIDALYEEYDRSGDDD